MQNIINKLGEITQDCVKRKSELEELISENEALKEDLKAKKVEIAEKKKELVSRESAVKHIEDAEKYLLEVHNASNKNAKEMKELINQRKAFEETENRVSKEHSDRATELNTREEALDVKEKKCEDREKEIDEIINKKIKKILNK